MPSAKPAAVGGFVLGALIIVVAAILFFGGIRGILVQDKGRGVFRWIGRRSRPWIAGHLPRGVRVGSVSAVALLVDARRMQARIPVQLKLEPDRVTLVNGSSGPTMLRRLIEAGLKARLESESLVTGQMVVDLDFRPELPVHLVGERDTDVPEIPSMPSDLQEAAPLQLTHAPIADTVTQAKQALAAIERVADRLELGDRSADSRRAARAGQHGANDGPRERRDPRPAAKCHGHPGRRAGTRHRRKAATVTVARRSAASCNGREGAAGVARPVGLGDSIVARGARPRDDLEATLRDLAASASALRDLSQALDRDPNIALLGRKGR